MANTIILSDAVQLLDTGVVLTDLQWVKADLHRGTAGNIKKILLCHKWHTEHKGGVGRGNRTEAILPTKRSPRHYENSTRNVQEISTGKIYKIHLRLITAINGKRVI